MTDLLRLRAPASAVIAETLRLQAQAAPRTGIERLFGRSPLTAESRPWYLGALGEQEVARMLAQLPPQWCVVHAIPVGRRGSDIDHLVIGPGGVFTVNAKHHEGANVWVGDTRLFVNGRPTDHLRNARYEARRAAKLLSEASGARVDVTPVIAVVGARRVTTRGNPDVVVSRSSQLAAVLRQRRPALRADEVAAVTASALAPATWGAPDAAPADLDAFARLRASVEAAARRRLAWGIAAFFAAGAGVVAVSSTLLGLLP
jgi:hypothetical protein